jgi:hypothetical protein
MPPPLTASVELVVAKGIYRITSGKTIVFDGLDDFIFDGGGSTFLFHLIPGGAGVNIKNCQRSVFSNFNLDWDWKVDPPAWVGRVTTLAPDQSFFDMRFETAAPLDPKKWVSKSEVTLVFSQKLPAHVPSDAILFNHRYGSHNVIIRNCYFHENRARGVLCNSTGWLIENNHFFHNQHAAMLLMADVLPGLWAQGFGARNVVVRGNRFEACNPKGANDGAAVQLGATVRRGTQPYPLLGGILFEANQFEETPGPTIVATSFKNLVFLNNAVVNRQKAPQPAPMRGSVRAELGTGLWVEGNAWTTRTGVDTPKLFYDAETTRSIVCRGNQMKT